MRVKKLLAFFLSLIMMAGLLSACNDGPEGNGPTADRVDGGWGGIHFDGQTVKLCISTNRYEECTFPAADIYTKGPDKTSSNEVAKEVLARNKAASDTLGIYIEYAARDLRYSEILEDIRNIVQTSAKNSPDIYNNDLYGLSHAMINGLLWNVKAPGEEVKNYFDFSAKGWYKEFVRGCTFDQEKLYIFAGDYFIDMIRMAWVIYVNHDIFAANLGKMPGWCRDIDTFYQFVMDGFWDLDLLTEIASRVHVDSGTFGVTEKTDTLVGLTTNHVTALVYPASSGITLYYQDKENGYTPCVADDIDLYQKLANKYAALMGAQGVFLTAWAAEGVVENTSHFVEGNVLFATSRLGEMEADALRNFAADKGLVPFPKWEDAEQENYHTVIHNQVELGCILNTAKAFSASSALMQYLNENSEKVVHAYYEKGLKYKYNDNKNARAMMDLVRETSDDPFAFDIGVLCEELYTGSPALVGLHLNNYNTISSTYASEKDAYNDCMRQMIERFKQMP